MVDQWQLSYENWAGKPQTVYIVFADREGAARFAPWWVRIFTCKDFRHCYVMQEQKLGICVTDPMGFSVRVSWFPVDIEQAAGIVAQIPQHRVVKLDTVYPEAYRTRGLITCVSVVKAMAGVTGWWVITPRQLYRHLLKLPGATEIE